MAKDKDDANKPAGKSPDGPSAELLKRVETLEAEQARQGDVLAKLCEEYSEARKVAVADWREYAGEEFVKAKEKSVVAQSNRREAMGKLGKYEQDHPDLKRGTDAKHADLVAKANEAVVQVAKTGRKVTELKTAAMAVVA